MTTFDKDGNVTSTFRPPHPGAMWKRIIELEELLLEVLARCQDDPNLEPLFVRIEESLLKNPRLQRSKEERP